MREREDADPSGSTAQFRAFVDHDGADTTQPWAMRAPGNQVAKLVAIVIGVAVILAIAAYIVLP